MREKYKKIVSVICCFLLLLLLFASVSNFLMRKTGYRKNADFYNDEQDYDVLFFGTSHMIMGISPMELWSDYGITSYNMANHGQSIPVDYWVLKNALDHTTPKLVVIDVFYIDKDYQYSTQHLAYLHEAFDSMPLSYNKVSAIYDLLPEGKRLEYLFPFALYHTRWNEIDASFFERVEPSAQKGANMDGASTRNYARVEEITPPELIEASEMNMEETVGKEYLRKMIELCQSQGIDVLLVAIPFSPSEEAQRNINSAQMIAGEYGIRFWDMNRNDCMVDYNTDFFDSGHLNSSGVKKVTTELGEYITEQFLIPDHRTDAIASQWNEDYAEYENWKVSWLKQQTSLDSYLMLLADKDFDVVIEINNDIIWCDKMYVHLLGNLGVDISDVPDGGVLITIDYGAKKVDVMQHFNTEENADIRILVLDGSTGETLDDVTFVCSLLEQEEQIIATANR